MRPTRKTNKQRAARKRKLIFWLLWTVAVFIAGIWFDRKFGQLPEILPQTFRHFLGSSQTATPGKLELNPVSRDNWHDLVVQYIDRMLEYNPNSKLDWGSQLDHHYPPIQLQSTQPPPAAPVTKAESATGLLSLWSTDQLLGQPGDERIKPLQTPDHKPPQQTQTTGSLPPLKLANAGAVRRVSLPDDKKWVALTFDLCERADETTGYDRAIVNLLRERKVAATFFAGGKWMRSHQEKTKQIMADPLFEIGNHGWTHGNLRVMTGERMREQIVWTQAQYETLREELKRKADARSMGNLMEKIPPQPAVMRFPYATCSTESLQEANNLGISAIQMDVLSGDPGHQTVDQLVRNVVSNVRPGSIVIFHANGRGHGTAVALPRIIKELQQKGFEFRTVSQLMETGIPETVNECYWSKPGDNLYIDTRFGEGTEKQRTTKRPDTGAQPTTGDDQDTLDN